MNLKATLVVVCACTFDVALGLYVLHRGGRSAITLRRFLLASMLVALASGAKILLASFRSNFLGINFAYCDTIVLVPLVGISLLFASRWRPVARSVRSLAWASLAIVPIGIDATFIEPFRLVTETAPIPLARGRAGSAPITIAVLADIQCTQVTDREREAIALAMAAKPDLILLPGDLTQVEFDELDELTPHVRDLLAPLDAPLGVYFVLGNCDSRRPVERMLAGTHVRLLDNEIVERTIGDRRVTIGGVDLEFDSRAAIGVLHRIEHDPATDDVRLLCAHRPDVMFALESPSRVDLVVAGHTHGGQVQIPFVGPLITLSSVPRTVAAGGFHELDGRRVYVSRGVGCERGAAPRVRFLCPPELSILTLGASARPPQATSDL